MGVWLGLCRDHGLVEHRGGARAEEHLLDRTTRKDGTLWLLKTTIEIPEALLRRAKSAAAKRGVTLRALVSEALADKLRADPNTDPNDDKPWMKGFGKLRHLHKETNRINRIIERRVRSD